MRDRGETSSSTQPSGPAIETIGTTEPLTLVSPSRPGGAIGIRVSAGGRKNLRHVLGLRPAKLAAPRRESQDRSVLRDGACCGTLSLPRGL